MSLFRRKSLHAEDEEDMRLKTKLKSQVSSLKVVQIHKTKENVCVEGIFYHPLTTTITTTLLKSPRKKGLEMEDRVVRAGMQIKEQN